MKKIFNIMAIALGILALSSCGEKELAPVEKKVKIVESELVIPAKGGEAKVILETTGAVKVDVDATWCTYTVNGDEVTFTAQENGNLSSRYAKAVFTVEDQYATVTIHQFGYFSCDFAPADITTSADAATFDYPYTYSEELVASTDADWITLTVTKDNLKVEIAENTTQATADNRSRKAGIAWKLGVEEGVINVEQLNIDFMQPDANWTVSYDGYKVYEGNGNMYEHIRNDVADPTVSGMYYFTYFTKDDFTASGLAMGDYITSLVPTLKAEADEVIAYYAEYGLTYSDLLYEDSDYEIFDKFEAGDYYACVVGFDDNFNPTGHYAVSEFTKESGPSSYDKWLGDWKCPHGNSTTKFDTWTFTVNEKGYTYWVSGIEGYTDLKIAVEYDEATEGIIVRAQEGLGTMTIGSKGECEMGFYGATTAGQLWTPGASPYAIFTATMNGDSAQLVPSPISTSSGEVEPDIAAYIGKDSSGGFTLPKSFNDATRTNVVLTKSGSGGGDDDDPDEPGGSGSADFNKFIGSWEVTPADASSDPWTTRLVEVTPDAEIAAYDWQSWTEDWVTPATVTYKNKKITFEGGTGVPLAENVSLDDSGEPYTIYYMSSCIIDGQSYVITSGDSMYDACVGEFDKDGNIVLTGLDVSLSDGGTYKFIDYGVVAISSDESAIYTFRNEAGEFPVTMKKASGSKSVKAFGNSWNLSLENAVKVDPSHVLKMHEEKLVEMQASPALSEPSRPVKFLVK